MTVRSPDSPAALSAAVESIQRIPVVPIILEVICRMTGMRFAAVARVTEERWIVCSVRDDLGFGLVPGGELSLETTLCNETRMRREAIVINQVSKSVQFCDHPTPKMYGFESYMSVPIVLPDGEFFGTLCAIDPKPAEVESPQALNTFQLFAELIAYHLDAQRRVDMTEKALMDERETSHLREQFIAVLGHDLRNPLNSISSATGVLARTATDSASAGMVGVIQRSVRRMASLIDDVLDFARGRLGSGLSVHREPAPLKPVLEQVYAELQTASPTRVINVSFDLPESVDCDRTRIGQLFSNLLGNALTHGTPGTPIDAFARVRDRALEIEVANQAAPISPETLARLFKPFERGSANETSQGLGLGLYISSEIARAHGGALSVESDERETRFIARLPLP